MIDINWRPVVASLAIFLAGQIFAVIIWGSSLDERVRRLQRIVNKHEQLVPGFYQMRRDGELMMIAADKLAVRVDVLEENQAHNYPIDRIGKDELTNP